MKAYYYTLILVAGLQSCQPELQPLGNGTAAPIACHFMGELDGQMVQFEAGVAQQFLHTALQTNALNLFETAAVIKPDPCDGCGNHLEITIRDFKRNNGNEPMNPDSTFQIKTYPFQLGETGASLRRIRLQQNNLDGLNPIQNQWSVFSLSNDLITQSNQIEANFTLTDGNYNTRLVSTFANGCSDTSSGQIVVDLGSTGNTCSAEMRINRIPNSNSMFLDTFNVQVPNPTQVIWRVGGEVYTGGSVFLMTDSFFNLNDAFEVALEIISASCTVRLVQRIAKDPSVNCATNFRVSSIQSIDPLQLGHVRLKWTDGQGFEYSSEKEEQPNWSVFEITAIDTFPSDRGGLPTVLLTGRVDARLFNKDGNGATTHKDLLNSAFKMAFPYKP